MMDDFQTAEVETDETSIFVRWFGSGPPSCCCTVFPKPT
jgi:hypothetical protein